MSSPLATKRRDERGSFIQHSRAWWHDANRSALTSQGLVDDVLISIGDHEFAVVWYEPFQGEAKPASQFRVFHDAWAVMPTFFLHVPFTSIGNLSPREFCGLLESCGYEDRTPVERS